MTDSLSKDNKDKRACLKPQFLFDKKSREKCLRKMPVYVEILDSTRWQWVSMSLKQVAGAAIWPGSQQTAGGLAISDRCDNLVDVPVVELAVSPEFWSALASSELMKLSLALNSIHCSRTGVVST